MFSVSSGFVSAIKNASREFRSKVLIGEDEYSDDKVINLILEKSMAPSDEFSLGAVVASKFELTIYLADIRNNKIIKPYLGLRVGKDFEYVPLGVFNIEEKSIQNGVVNIKCFDNIGKFEKPYFSDLNYPTTIQRVANEICSKAGVTLATTLPTLNIDKKIDGYTCREALSFIASACGGFAIANRTGAIEIKSVGSSTSSINGDNYFTFENDDAFVIKKLTAHIDENTVISRGEGIGVEEVEFKNPIANNKIMDHIYSKLKNYTYVPGNLVWQGSQALDVGDKMSVTDIGGIKRDILIMRDKITYSGGLRGETNSVAKSLGKSNFNYGGSMQGAVDRVTAEQIVVKELLADKASISDLNAINANIENLTVSKADIEQLQATNANIENLKANKANISDLNATNAIITNLQATKADIVDLTAATGKITVLESEVAKIGVLEGDVANIQDIVSGNISSDNIQSGGITGDRLNMNTIFVNDANIVNVNANKINSGEINTNKVKIKSADGGIEIVGPTQQWKDKNNKVRMQAGKDAQGNFTFGIFDETGTGTLIDHTGIKEKALGSNIIKENMISSDAVGEKQINYNSFASGFNKDTNTSTLKATKVRLDNQNQTLDVAFTSLKSQADATKTTTESNTTQINVQQGQISTAIANTKIVKDGKEVLLKDDYNTTVATVNSMKNTISSHTTKIDNNTGKITGVESKTNVLERDLNSMSSKISATETTVKTHTTQITTAQNTANSATSKADKAQTDANKGIADAKLASEKIDKIEIGGRNYLILSKLRSYTPYNSVVNENGVVKLKLVANTYITLSISEFTPKNKKYTMSGIAKLNGNPIPKDFFKNNKANTYNGGSSIIVIENDGRFRITETWVGNSAWLFHCNTTAVNNDIITFEKLKFEEGEKNTDWTPAPEDVQEKIDKNKNDIITVNTEVTTTKNKVSGIEQNLDSITTRVGSVESTTTTHTATINSHTSSLNAVDGKINTAKTDAINTSKADATTKANDAKNQALSGAATDAQNKANKALNDAKSYTGAEITKVNSTMTSKFAEIKTTTDSITQSVSNTNKEVSTVKVNVTNAQNSANTANSKIDGLEIGGRNLAQGTNKYITSGSSTGMVVDSDSIKKQIGKKITVSVDIEITKGISSTNNGRIGAEFSVQFTDGSNQYFGAWEAIGAVEKNTKKRIVVTTIISNKTISTVSNLGLYIQRTTSGSFKVGRPKVELGTKNTDWIPAPEDTSKEILDITTEKVNQAKADIKITTDAITSKVNAVESTTTTLNGKVIAHESRLTSAEQKITPNAIINTVSSTIDNKVAVVDRKLTEVKQESDKLQIKIQHQGVSNLVENSSFEENVVISTVKSQGCVNAYRTNNIHNNVFAPDGGHLLFIDGTGDVYAETTLEFLCEGNTTYTISADVHYASEDGFIVGSSSYVYFAGHVIQVFQNDDFGFYWHRVSTTFTTPDVGGVKGAKATLRFGFRSNVYGWGAFDKVKVEKGTQATAWCEGGSSYGNISFTTREIKAEYENGAITTIGREGFYYRAGGGAFEYHALSLVGSINVPSEETRYVYVPEIFRNKNIKVICQVAQIGNGTDAINNPKPIISFWAGATDIQNNPGHAAPYFGVYASTRLRNNDGSVAYRDKAVLVTYTVVA